MTNPNRYSIHIEPYNPEWAREFDRESSRLLGLLAPNIVRIEHGGSTAVPGLAAKPVIDLFAAAAQLLSESEYTLRLDGTGYRYVETGMTGRLLFVKETGESRTHHLHLLPAEGFSLRNELLFRDYLRKHSEWVEAYALLKRDLAERYPEDPDMYTRAKTGLIQQVIDLARAELGLPLLDVWTEQPK